MGALIEENMESAPKAYLSVETKSLVRVAKQKHITMDQRESMLNFVRENPEIITHTSTIENEQELWETLTEKLNVLKPEKNVDSWKKIFARWRITVFSKPESHLKNIDCRLKNFLSQLMKGYANGNISDHNVSKTKPGPRKRMSSEDIEKLLRDVEKEKVELNFELDDIDVKIAKYQDCIKFLENQFEQKKDHLKKLTEKKASLNYRKRKMENIVEEDSKEDILDSKEDTLDDFDLDIDQNDSLRDLEDMLIEN